MINMMNKNQVQSHYVKKYKTDRLWHMIWT